MLLSTENDGIKLFGERIRQIRQSKDFTQQHLANIAEIELSQIYRIETGKINTKLSTILIIAKALDVSPKDLFEFNVD